jgi:hypothetical protein
VIKINIWQHKDWQTHIGTWLIASAYMSDNDIVELVLSNPEKYGGAIYWEKVK